VICVLPQAFFGDLRPATIEIVGPKDKISFYIVNVNFSKIVAFKRDNKRIFFKMVAVHIEGLRHPPICLIDIRFRVSVP
jgi:hypothetical protein